MLSVSVSVANVSRETIRNYTIPMLIEAWEYNPSLFLFRSLFAKSQNIYLASTIRLSMSQVGTFDNVLKLCIIININNNFTLKGKNHDKLKRKYF